MNTITKANIQDYVLTGEFSIPAKVRPELGSDEVKDVTLVFQLENTPLLDIVGSSLKDKRINWQSGARKKFDSIPQAGIVKVKYSGGREVVDPEVAIANRLRAMSSEEDRQKYIAELLAKAKNK